MAGYIGPAPVPQATQTREVFILSSTQTTVGTGGYTPGFVDVYLNGAKLAPADFTATNGSDIVLASAAAANDILEVVAFQEFTVVDQTFSGDITFTGANYNVVWDASDNALEFGDNAKAIFGAGSDLQIYHNGSASFIDDAGNGYLNIRGNGVSINKYTGETMALFVADGAATLYHDNAVKLATTSTGIDVTGTVTSDGLTVDGEVQVSPASGTAKLRLTSQGSGSEVFSVCGQIEGVSNTGFAIRNETDSRNDLLIDGSGNVGIGTSPNTTLTLGDGTDEFDFGVTTNVLTIKTVTSDGSDDQRIVIDAGSGGLSSTRGAYVALSGNEASSEAGKAIYQMGNVSGASHVFRKAGGTDAVTIDSSGRMGIGVSPETTSNGNSLSINRTVVNDDDAGSFHLSQNAYYNSAWKYVENGTAEKITFASGVTTFDRAVSNSSGADASLSWLESMRIDSSGNVGIGVSPTDSSGFGRALDVSSNTGAGLYLRDGGDSTFAAIGMFNANLSINSKASSGNIVFYSNDSEKVRIDGNGQIGISGSTTSFDTTGAVNGLQLYYETDSGLATIGSYGGSTGSTALTFHTNSGTSASEERMRIDASGRVGIGTSSMSSFYATKFVVNVGDEDGITIYNDGANERAYIMFADATSGTGRYAGQISYDHNNDQMSFTTAANTAVTIDSSNDFIVGAASSSGDTDNFAKVTAGHFTTANGRTSVASTGVATTLHSFSSNAGNFIVSALASGTGNIEDNTTAIVHINANSTSKITTLLAGSRVVLSMSGANLQVTQSIFGNANIDWSVMRIR